MSSDKLLKDKTSYISTDMSSNILDQEVPEIKVPILKPTKMFQPSSLKQLAKKISCKDGYILVYFGAGWDFTPIDNPLFSKFNHFIFIDSLPNLSHYYPGSSGYEKSKDRTTLIKTLKNEALKFKLRLISIRNNLLTFKNDRIKLEHYINTTVEEALTNTTIRKKINKAIWVHEDGFSPYAFGLKPGDLPKLVKYRAKLGELK